MLSNRLSLELNKLGVNNSPEPFHVIPHSVFRLQGATGCPGAWVA